MATHTQFHGESAASAAAAGEAIDSYLHNPAIQSPGFAAAIATDAGYSDLRWLMQQMLSNFVAANRTGDLSDVITAMAEDRSNNWTDEIATLEGVEQRLLALREANARLARLDAAFEGLGGEANARLARLHTTFAGLGGEETALKYAMLGEYTAAILGANEEWDISFPEGMAEHWQQIGGTPAISDQSTAALTHWRSIADRLGIEHDAPEEAAEDDPETCREEDCTNGLDDGEGYDGLCGEHADEAEERGEWDSE